MIDVREATLIALATALLLAACSPLRVPTPLTEQAERARTHEQHLAVAGRYREYAAHLREEAARHASLAAAWSRREAAPVGSEAMNQLDEGRHCRDLAALLSQAAAEAEAIAQDQEGSGAHDEQ